MEEPATRKRGSKDIRVAGRRMYRFLMGKIQKVRMSNGAEDERADKSKR